jgi:4-hydroxythreonine-4-phosphate dehydrogenase
MAMVKPIVAVTMGDVDGISPEVVAKSLAELLRQPQSYQPVVIGSVAVMEKAFHDLAIQAKVRRISDVSEALEFGPSEQNLVAVLGVSAIKPGEYPIGQPSAAAGKATMECAAKARELAEAGKVQAVVTAPGNSDSNRMAGSKATGQFTDESSVLTLISGNLRVGHMTDHVSLKEACDFVTKEHVLQKLKLMDRFLKMLGLPRQRIAVAGVNPHAHGDEDERELKPAVQEAQGMGMNVEGPFPPDTIFWRATQGEFDAVLAMYHDQGHGAIKMYGFDRGVASITLGRPYIGLSPAHGTAYDIAGKGVANPGAMRQCITMAGQLAIGGKLA